ncbi:adenosine kinase [Henriciella marina]|uniref:Adenosine kinase n=1 Tax=Henriciella marina TaxID=453851 RepID=A0ABT4LRJ6_9PROT|nr:adenosine kinase [Henriciella marina]MCZ4296980.1 adenosine kinase [Henriciella marina]
MTDTRFDVVGLGNAIVDVFASVEDSFLEQHDIRKNGMTLIDEERADALVAAAPDGPQLSGGSGANTIVGISSFGGQAGYIGKVARDTLGDVFRKDMNDSGIPFDTPALEDGPATARCIVFVTPDGARSMNTFLGASVLFSASDVNEQMVKDAAILYLEGYLFDQEDAKAAFVHASELAQAAGRKVALTLSDGFCVERHRDSFLHLIKNHVDLVFANEDEALSLYQTDNFDEAVERMQADAGLAAITRSEKGSVVISPEGAVAVAAEPVDKVVDTTGAGDQYAAGFLFGVSRGLPLETCAKLGHIAAAEVISHYGPRPEVSLAELARKAGIET